MAVVGSLTGDRTRAAASETVFAGCALSGDNNWLKITGHKGGSMLLPCSCSDLHSKPQRFTWESDRTGYLTEVFNNKQYNDRINLFNNTSPANLSLLISDLREEDQGIYKCSTEKEHRFIWLYVKGCELVKKTVVEEVTGFIGESVVLPCICTDLQDDPKTVTWELNNIKIYSEQTGHHSNRVKLVSKNPPGDLSLLISDLTEEDQGTYRCSVQADYRDFRLYVKGGRRGEKVNVEGHQDCEGRQEDQVAAGCALSVKNHIEITQLKGRSVLLPCSCSDLHSKPQKLTWGTFKTGRLTEVLNDEHYRGRYQLFNNISPANLSLLISDLREEDQGLYRCSTEKEHRDIWLYVKGCELVKKTVVENVTGFIGESVVLPCVCTDLQDAPKRVTWKFNKNNHFQEIYSKQTGHHSNRVKVVSKNLPGNLSLLISVLTEEDQGIYKCSAQADHRDLRLSVKGGRCEENVVAGGHQDCEGKQEDQIFCCVCDTLQLSDYDKLPGITFSPDVKRYVPSLDYHPTFMWHWSRKYPGCELVKKTAIEKVTGFTGESVVLPCVCTDIHHNPSSVKWEFNKKEFGKDQEIYPKLTGHHRNRVKLVSKNSPGNLSLLISDLTEEDQGIYTCFVQAEKRDLILFVEVLKKRSFVLIRFVILFSKKRNFSAIKENTDNTSVRTTSEERNVNRYTYIILNNTSFSYLSNQPFHHCHLPPSWSPWGLPRRDGHAPQYFPLDGTPLTVLGDFNLPSDKLQSSCLLPFLNTFSLTFNSCPPTHKGGNVLDLVFTRPTPATDMTATPLPISDHHRGDVATDSFLSSLSSTMDLLCPLTTRPKKTSCPTPWLSEVLRSNRRELQSAERKWKKSQLDVDLSSYHALLTKFSLEVTSAKTAFYKEKLEASAQDPRKLHYIFSSLLNPPAAPAPSSLTANDFASFYDEKIRKICQTFTSSPTMITQHSQQSTTSLSSFSTLTEDEILQVIRSCNPTTCPLDPIPSTTLQTITQDLLPFISTIINGSLTSGYVPTTFKQARVIPILKKPALDPSDINNYRPNNLHDPNQSGFKAAHSTETALLAVSEKLHAARSAKLSSVLIFLDLSAAFDTVNHKTLLSTLKSLARLREKIPPGWNLPRRALE
ncbi:hypothetical protein C0J45_16133 [Silurus meridionalis]|nr:hypothetical protein C0J45_16133 [Silurus meridionalis]